MIVTILYKSSLYIHVGLIRVIKTNLMRCLSSVYFVRQPLHVWGIFVAHDLEVCCIYTRNMYNRLVHVVYIQYTS